MDVVHRVKHNIEVRVASMYNSEDCLSRLIEQMMWQNVEEFCETAKQHYQAYKAKIPPVLHQVPALSSLAKQVVDSEASLALKKKIQMSDTGSGKSFAEIIDEEMLRRQVMKHDVCRAKLMQLSMVAEVVGIQLPEENPTFVKSEIVKVNMDEMVKQMEEEERQKADVMKKQSGLWKIKKSFGDALKKLFKMPA